MRAADVKVKNVLVTGCSSGIGLATAILLRTRGWNVIAGARKPADLARLSDQGFSTVSLDMASGDSMAAAVQEVLKQFDQKIGGLVNNAGFGQFGALEDLSRDALAYQFQVNVIGLQDLTNRLLPAMRAQGFGRIVNISSVLGRVSLPFMGAYSATKFAVEALSDALRVELIGTGIGVSLVEPGPIATAFQENAASRANDTLHAETSPHADYYQKEIRRRQLQKQNAIPFTLPPEAVALKILHALESAHPKTRFKVTIPAYGGALLARFAPDALLDAMMARSIRKSEP